MNLKIELLIADVSDGVENELRVLLTELLSERSLKYIMALGVIAETDPLSDEFNTEKSKFKVCN